MNQNSAADPNWSEFVNKTQAHDAEIDRYEPQRISCKNAAISYFRQNCNDYEFSRRLMTINQEDREFRIARNKTKEILLSGDVARIKKHFRYPAQRNVTVAAQIDTSRGATVPVTAGPQADSLQNGNHQRQTSALNPAVAAFITQNETSRISGSDSDHSLRHSKALPSTQKETPSISKGDDLSRPSLPTPPSSPQSKTPSICESESSLAVGLSTPPTTPGNVTPPSQEWPPSYSPWLPKDHVQISPYYSPTYIHENDAEKKARRERSRQRARGWEKWRKGEGAKPGPDPDLHFNWGRKWSDKYWPVRKTEEEDYMQQPFETLSYLDL